MKFFIVFLVSLTAFSAMAAESSVTDQAGPIERTVRSDLRVLADHIDRLFGKERADDNKSTSTLRLSVNEKMEEGKADQPSFGVRFNLKLATLQRWNKDLNNWFNQKMHHLEEELREETGKHKGPPTIDRVRPGEKVDYEIDPWRFSIDKRVNVAKHLDVKAQLGVRASKDIETSGFLHSFASSLGWSTDNLWQTGASLNSAHRITSKLLFNFGNSVNWSISRKNFSTGHGPSLSYSIAQNQAVSFGLGMGTAIVNKVWSVQSYSISSSYRLQTLNNWLFFSFSPFLEFSRAQRFGHNIGFNSGLEIVF